MRTLAPKRLGLALLGLLAAALPAHADVTLQEALTVNGGGLMSLADMNGTTTTQISGPRARIENNVQMQSRLVRLFAGGPTAEITRLDDDKVYSLDLKKKQYTSTTVSARRAEIEQAQAQMAESQKSKSEAASPVDQSQCDWSPPKSEVKKSGEKASIAGYDTERVTITVTQSCKHRETGDVCDFGLALDQWLSPKFDGGAEQQAFYRAYAEKMGFGTSASPGFAQNAQAMFAGYKDLWAEIAKQTSSAKGYPLRSSFALAIGGAQCGTSQPQDQAAGATTPGADEVMAAAGQIGSAIGGLFGKKKEAAPAAAAQTPPPLLVNGMTPLMTVSTELLSISREPVPAGAFDPPADFKAIETP